MKLYGKSRVKTFIRLPRSCVYFSHSLSPETMGSNFNETNVNYIYVKKKKQFQVLLNDEQLNFLVITICTVRVN